MSKEIDTENLKELTPKLAATLAKQDDLRLDNVSTISDAVAVELAKHKGDVLALDGLATISDSVAAALAKQNGRALRLGLTLFQMLLRPRLVRVRMNNLSLIT